jgi:CO/xanthine dehydrogenase FAD-binding subunit
VIIAREGGSSTHSIGAQRVDARIRIATVFVVGRGEPAEDERNRDHVLHAMVAVGGVRERAFLVDDAQAGLVRAHGDGANVGAFRAAKLPRAASWPLPPRSARETPPDN